MKHFGVMGVGEGGYWLEKGVESGGVYLPRLEGDLGTLKCNWEGLWAETCLPGR